ncbi:hypothetical protein [Sulfoacidibacillus thermotolerans]|uniref:Uncharacterized protein n=1 Tax=Sulfoacidibacillus thermotolerans TaxID=1765684 RepID=A0A2U3CMB5_SULT2|nr:hypothetical protein [Sulfoacidibacillus thermotolerans]PWI50190.1 hypothetical protein BM613_14575 [Sulfoacidibacillus thermotolerans]
MCIRERGEASPTEEVVANGNVTLNFFANYRALASGVRPGVAKADAIFMINLDLPLYFQTSVIT